MAPTRVLSLIMPVAVMLAFLAAPARAQVPDPYPPLQQRPVFPEWPTLKLVVPMPLEPSPTPRRYLGRLSVNPHDPDSVVNPFGRFGNLLSPDSVNNPIGRFGNRFSPSGATNPFTTWAPKLYGQDGTYLGELSANPYDPDSITNPYGRYGSSYSPDSVNNPFGRFGSPYSPASATNPYNTHGPFIIGR